MDVFLLEELILQGSGTLTSMRQMKLSYIMEVATFLSSKTPIKATADRLCQFNEAQNSFFKLISSNSDCSIPHVPAGLSNDYGNDCDRLAHNASDFS